MLALPLLTVGALEEKSLTTDWAPSDAWSAVTYSSKAAAYSERVSYSVGAVEVGVTDGGGTDGGGRRSRRASALSYPLRWASRLVARVTTPYSFVKESLVTSQD